MAAASVIGGLALLALVVIDVYSTVLHHWGGAGPLSGRFVHTLWRLAVRITRPFDRARRRRMLGAVGPMMIPLIIGLWAGLTIVAFALLYYPWIVVHFGADTGVPAPSGFGDALHFSGVSFFTIGYGDLVPSRGWVRALGVIEGGAGFAFITLAISYFTSLYAGYGRQKTTAESVHLQAARSADAAQIIRRHVAGGETYTLAVEVGRLRDGLAAIRTDYTNYPILHFFVASEAEQSLLRLLFVCHELGALLDSALEPEQDAMIAGLGERSGLRYAAVSIQEGIAETLLRSAERDRLARHSPSEADVARWRERFARATRLLGDGGVTVRHHADAEAAYLLNRASWEPTLRACAAALGESWDEVSGGN